jgi:hypothetical protein
MGIGFVGVLELVQRWDVHDISDVILMRSAYCSMVINVDHNLESNGL